VRVNRVPFSIVRMVIRGSDIRPVSRGKNISGQKKGISMGAGGGVSSEISQKPSAV